MVMGITIKTDSFAHLAAVLRQIANDVQHGDIIRAVLRADVMVNERTKYKYLITSKKELESSAFTSKAQEILNP